MSKSLKEKETESLLDAIIEGIQRKKGLDIVKIDLTQINYTECNYFIICNGSSNTHTASIAQSIEETVEEIIGEKAWHKDGYQNALWILLDYSNIMVHVFQKESRDFYDLENLWADALVVRINEENKKENDRKTK